MPTARSHTARADAARNRARILEAGRTVLATEGPGAPFYEIARVAGVGQATLYRHFPNKASLVHAIAEANVDALAAAVGEVDRFDQVVLALAESTADNAEIAGLLAAEAGSEWYEALVERVVDLLAEAAERGRAGGTVRSDLSRGDLRLLLQMLGSAATSGAPDERRRQARRAVELCLDGVLR